MFIPLATSSAPPSLRDCSVRWLLLQVVTEAAVRQTITHCNGVTSWTVLLLAALRKRSCITCPRDLNAHRKQASQTQTVRLTSFYSAQSISIAAIECSAFFHRLNPAGKVERTFTTASDFFKFSERDFCILVAASCCSPVTGCVYTLRLWVLLKGRLILASRFLGGGEVINESLINFSFLKHLS